VESEVLSGSSGRIAEARTSETAHCFDTTPQLEALQSLSAARLGSPLVWIADGFDPEAQAAPAGFASRREGR
jgi:hypothetical protein